MKRYSVIGNDFAFLNKQGVGEWVLYEDARNEYTKGVIDGMKETFDIQLRDHFAGLAMQGMIASTEWELGFVAEDAYKIADAMLKEREK